MTNALALLDHDAQCTACGEPCDPRDELCVGCAEDLALNIDWSADEGSVPWHVESDAALA